MRKAKLTKNQVKEIKQLLMEGKMFQKDIGKRFNVSHYVISDIARGRTYCEIKEKSNNTDKKHQELLEYLNEINDTLQDLQVTVDQLKELYKE
jgi:hypothetical protein